MQELTVLPLPVVGSISTQSGSMAPEREHGSSSEGEEEAPEELTFQTAKSQALESARKRQQEARREKALLKEKRKLKEERFKEQKKRKLLSIEILQDLTALPEQQLEHSEDKETFQEEDDSQPKSQTNKKLEKKLRPKKRLQNNYNVVRLEDYNLLNVQEEKAKTFIQKTLYGKWKNRTTASEFFSVSSKIGDVKRPAVQFTDNTWAKDEKRRAEKFMQSFKNRRKI
ncbi:nucleolar 7 [Pelobates cultripes]|uniref:Nucleolar 7 n=1 Tax=Pelobates cultripes TaxID=61616 RepID=A0AAD1W2Q0_PELCU|nr:nucleolar 7 [Pelobates cultripes]